MSNQGKEIIDYIKAHGSITQAEAFMYLGIGRLSARIYDLVDSGYPIKRDMVTVTKKDGSKARVARYYMGATS